MRLLREILDSARATGLGVVVGEGCPKWLAELAGTDADSSVEAPKLLLVSSHGLSLSAPQLNDWVLVVLDEAMAQLAPTLAAKVLAGHALQALEAFTIPQPSRGTVEPGWPECLVLTRVVGQPLAINRLNPWVLEPQTQTLSEQLLAGNQTKLQAIASGVQLSCVATQRDAALAKGEELMTQAERHTVKIEQLKESRNQLRQESTTQVGDLRTQVGALRTQVRLLQRRVRTLDTQSPWSYMRPKLGAALRKVPGGGQLLKLLKRLGAGAGGQSP